MCEPITFGTGLSAGVSAVSGFLGGQAEARAHSRNAAISRERAVDARQRGDYEANRNRGRVSQMIGKARAALASSGFVISSADELLADTAEMGELDTLTILNNAAREAHGFETEAANFDFLASQSRRRGNIGALVTGAAGAFTTVATGRQFGLFRGGSPPLPGL